MLRQYGNNREARVYRALQEAVSLRAARCMTHTAVLAKLAKVYESSDYKSLRRYQQEWVKGYATCALNTFANEVQAGYHVNGKFIGCSEEKSSGLLRALNQDALCFIWSSTGIYYIEPKTYEFQFTEPTA